MIKNKFKILLIFILVVSILFFCVIKWELIHIFNSTDHITLRKASRNLDLPNILLIGVDTLRADHLKCYGYSKNTSSNIDRLAQKGVLFRNTISQIPLTNPSFTSIFTSLYPHEHGAQNGIPPHNEFITLPEILKKHGFITAAFISGYPLIAKISGLQRGFDLYNDKLTKNFRKNFSTENTDRTADETTDLAIKWLTNNKDKRFFLWIHYYDPHTPYIPPAPYNKLFLNEKKKSINIQPEKDFNFYISQYDGEIAYTDSYIGNLLKKLEMLGIRKRTLILFISDHGESLTEHNDYFDHGLYLYDEQIKVPFIISYPSSVPENKIIDSQVRCIDLMPTLLNLLGIPIPKQARGVSLVPLIFGEQKKLQLEAYSETSTKNISLDRFSVRYEESKFIYTSNTKVKELYNIEKDPNELVNIIDENLNKAKDLEKRLFNWISEYKIEPKRKILDNVKKTLRSLGYFQ